MLRKLLLLALVLLAAPAHAQWRQATSKHFIIYSDAPEKDLREATLNLEKYDHIIRAMSGTTRPHSPIKLKIYQMRNMGAVRATLPYGGYGVGGYYNTTLRGPFAVSTRRGFSYRSINRTINETGMEWGPEVLQHEYTHHFMHQYFPGNYPTWYSEGFAEFYGTMAFKDENVVEVGHAPMGRMDTIRGDWLPMEKMLTAKSYADVGSQIGSLYAQGWLLVHYAANNSDRKRQLDAYLAGVASGKSYEDAAKAAFGEDLGKLDSELRRHANKLTALRMSLKPIDVGPIDIRPLTDAEHALLQSDIALSSGVPAREAKQFASVVRSKARPFMADPYALRLLIEAERAAGNNAEAMAAVDRLLALDPADPKGLMHKAELRIGALKDAKSADKQAWDQARQLILDANRAAPNDPEILTAYYDSFEAEGVLPPPPAQNALMQAHTLLPQNDTLRYRVASDFENRGMIQEAIFVIGPAAFSVHEEEDEKEKREREKAWEKYRLAGDVKYETPREMLTRLEKKLADSKSSATANASATEKE